MPMINNDSAQIRTREQIRESMMQALKNNDAAAYSAAFDEMMQRVAADLTAEHEAQLAEIRQSADAAVLAQRGVRQLTSQERTYYQAVIDAMKSPDPRQALQNPNLVLPETTINAVFDELQTRHPLLSRINFRPSGGAVELVMAENGYQMAQWGELCDDIVKELLAGFVKINTMLFKLSAFLPVCKAMLDLGPEWLDDFVRQVLYEALANGLEYGVVAGTGNNMPIGMNREVGPNVTVTGGVYPIKTAVKLNDLRPETIGRLLSILATDPSGKPRQVRDVILLVSPTDYFLRVMPATTVQAADGSYRNNVLPYPMDVIQTLALNPGEAIIGIAYRYFAVAGTAREGRIEYSDHYRFLEDERVYLIKAYANGMPMDNNAFQTLDISGLQPLTLRVEQVEGAAASSDATLASLSLGTAALSPAFAANTITYTAATTNATNVVRAIPADAGATVEVKLGNTAVANGSAVTWATGSNTLTVKVTAEDGTTTKTYTVTVTKS